MKNIFLFGECMIELRAHVTSTSSSKLLQQAFSGDALNTSVYMKRTFPSLNTNFISALGADSFSQQMRLFFQEESIGSEFVFQSESKLPGLYAIDTDDTGERFFTYWRDNSAARSVMTFIDEQIVDSFSQGDMFFFSGISLAVIRPNERSLFWKMLGKLKLAGVSIVFDPNYRARMWDQPEQAKEQFEQAFSIADIALPGVDDFQQLYGITTSEAVFDFCQQFNINELVIKNADASIFCYSERQVYKFNVSAVENVVDATSAGDSFNGVYLGARATGLNLSYAIELASKAAGFVIQHQGAIVNKQDFTQFIDAQFT